ncbi:MAG: gliding motility-associated C-terminal domain-containing protein [Flavobacteriales bacterium]|nr:gliding motility-associated C-terminal domain-containing protein [Flavobacteriales bacterium]
MARNLLFILFHLISELCFAQNWINSAGGNYNDESYDVEVDQFGNIYTTGYTTSSSIFGPSINLTTNGFSDIYVSKNDANGNFLWVKVFGGPQADRGYDIAVDSLGNIYVTGYFIGSATFGSTTLTSSGNSQDIFILKLDNSGNVVWAKSEGGTDGDTGYGITFDNLGNVIVTGQFKGNAQIGTNNFSSAIDPNTGLPAYDIFISKYDMNGNNLWSIQGTAKYDDRGLALKTDLANNIYITGQFSDTLTIAGSTHNNTIYNAGMLLKLDPNGNEVWFKRLGAVQTLVYDIEIDNSNDIYITGDFQGQMIIISNNGNVFLNGNYTYRIFLIKMDADGNIKWMQEDDSNSEVSSKAITLDQNQDPYITGIFKCIFKEYADTLGSGLFNSVGYNDIFITKYDKNGTRKWMRQYGGPLDDYCSGIAISNVDNPIISGGYTEYFNYPVGLNFSSFNGINNNFSGYSWSTSCANSYYKYLNSVGSKDILIGKPVDLVIPHYYYYENTTCYDYNLPCINSTCIDSLVFCGNGGAFIDTHTAGNGSYNSNYNSSPNYHHGPYFDFLWSNTLTNSSIGINTSGEYSVETERIDGCVLKRDTVFVTINPIPQMPHLTDGHYFNTQQYPSYNNMELCFPDTVTTWFGDLDTSYQFLYSTPSGTFYLDSLPHQIFEPGNYSVSVLDSNNCSNSASFNLNYDYPLFKDTIIPYIIQLNDTICIGQTISFVIADSLTNPTGLPNAFCSLIYNQNWNISGGGNCLQGGFSPTSSGWYNINCDFVLGYENLCGLDTTHYFVQDSFYVEVLPKPTLNLNISGDPLLCPGDTINVWTDTIVSGFNWNGPGIITITNGGDSIFANQQGNYQYSGTITDTTTGCSNYISDNFSVSIKPSPTIVSNVPDNIVCPNDSIELTCLQAGTNYEWVGPQGNVIGNTQSIWVNVPGFYHCVLTDFDGCILTSNTIELKEYNTPYILADPGTELCHTGAIELTAIYSGSPGVQWHPSGSANDPSIIVNMPGTYYVQVTQCGFTVIDSVVITQANVNASVTLITDSIICPGDTAILSANAGMGGYEWQPSQYFGQILHTTDTGYYYVTVTESSTGCTAVSDTIHIGYHNSSSLPIVINDTICKGDSSILFNLNFGYTTNWYSDSNSITPFYIGDTLIIYNVINDSTIYVNNSDSNCSSSLIPITIYINPSSITPSILGDTEICMGDTLTLSTNAILNGQYNWTGPNGFTSTQNNIEINIVDTTNAGNYSLSIADDYCSSGDTNVIVTVLANPEISINLHDTLWKCLSDSILLLATGDYSSVVWSNGILSDSTYAILDGEYFAIGTGLNNCSSSSDTVVVKNFILPSPQLSDTTVCFGDSVILSSHNNIILNWYDSSFTLISIDSIFHSPPLFNTTNYFATFTDSNGCESPSKIITVNVVPANGSPNIYGDTTICEGQSLLLSTDIINGATYQWSNSSGILGTSSNFYNPSVNFNDSGYYYLSITGSSCINSQGNVFISISPKPEAPIILGDTIYCNSGSLLLYSNNTNDSLIWMDSQLNPYYEDSLIINNLNQNNSGDYYLVVKDENGCLSNADTTSISILNSPPIPSIYGNISYCVGDTLLLYTDSIYQQTYFWEGPNGVLNNQIHYQINDITSNQTGLYTISITDTNGCQSSNSIFVNVFDYPMFDLGNDTIVCIDSLEGFILEIDTVYSEYLWQDGSTLNFLNVLDSGLYHVTVVNGVCNSSDSIMIQLDSCLINDIPNIFTPNGDGINDYFIIENIEKYPNSKLEVFNRWGRIIFKDDNYKNDWDANGINSGTYYYLFYPNDSSGKLTIQKGFITIIR